MDHIGIDVHKRECQICILTEGGELLEKRIPTDRGRFAVVLGGRPRARILIEASTESEWVARCLEALGHEVIVADPNFAPMYATRSRKVKTDRRDARTLAEACRLGAYRPAHRTADAHRHMRGQLTVREALVRTRARYISLIQTLLRQEGLRVRSGTVEHFLSRLEEVDLPAPLRSEIAPLVVSLPPLHRQIEEAEETIARLAVCEPDLRRLCTVPGVGLVTAASFTAALDQATRFAGAHQVESYLGLVPRETSSGERQHRGSITKAGNRRVRCLLVQVAWSILRQRKPETAALREWAERIAARRGRPRAVVALARRLAGILYAMLRDGTAYQPARLGRAATHSPVAA